MKRAALAGAALLLSTLAASAWEPTKSVEIIVPFGPGGASDQMARTMQAIIQKHGFSKESFIVVNKPAATGGEAMMEMKKSKGDPHKLITTSSTIYMTPLATKIPVSWHDFTPVAMVAQDEFGLWVNAESPIKSVSDLAKAAKEAHPPLKVGGGGSKREDELVSFGVFSELGAPISYIPYKSGGEASTQLAGNHIVVETNNPSEDVANWRAGLTRPLCVLSPKRIAYTAKVTTDMAWSDVPTCGEQGLKFTYNMLRGLFLPSGVTPEQQAYYVDLIEKVTATPEWKEYLERNALKADVRTGKDYVDFLNADEAKHKDLMAKAGFLPTN
ncbi:tripartite tricarboxylate transporter substrate-binding protein [Ancylobacter sp. MQZ15Z-1]|uniref:Tripartite tricarboxylate transporter substrate-binding protein n=1 Tax=Ancylobacter mangrovi TaxID=2972472 RepID=A0A9X2PHK7_9HYPH|nr:tripartite tricarboxylate transporter substrate-binding protein [Ancylobacter mangrovi]MCS0497236.1 tripartite tricarboxylate transporter substrate-binding protein [Ancylobacter mangrovi]